MNWLIVAIVLLLAHKEYLASPTPLKLPGHTQRLTPYIKHWEVANFERAQLHEAHKKHIEQKRHRRKRDLNAAEYGPAHTIRLNFFAHDREFRLVLRQNPLSVFAGDVQIENSLGPMDYDITRIYTGSLEDDENSHIHAILTSDNLLDGTIETSTEHYYIEPAHRYSHDLAKSGIHSIVYKVSDVNMQRKKTNGSSASATTPTADSAAEHCASERLRRSMLLDDLKRRKSRESHQTLLQYNYNRTSSGDNNSNQRVVAEANATATGAAAAADSVHNRHKRWLPAELSATATDDHQNPPLPLDLDVPYNDDYSIFSSTEERSYSPFVRTTAKAATTTTATTKSTNKQRNQQQQASVITWRSTGTGNGAGSTYTSNGSGAGFTPSLAAATIRNRNMIVNNYNPNLMTGTTTITTTTTDATPHESNFYDNNYNSNNVRKTYTKHKNIIVSNFNRSSSSGSGVFSNKNNNFNYNGNYEDNNNFINSFFNTNWTTMFNANDRPSHKTHVEIITKNGATKKPNIIVNNYNPPEIMLTPTHNQHDSSFNSMVMTNILSGRGQGAGGDGNSHNSGNSVRALYDRKITCMLYLQADHTFFQKMGSDEASIEAITRHVQRANTIYKNTDFNNDGKPDNITFMIKRIKVHNSNALKDPAYRFPGNYGVEKFLELFSEEDYDAFCLAYMFTYRDFEMGTLGLAWTGDLKNAGGVCEKNGHYRGSLKSLNTGIVTLLNYGKHVPPAVSHVTLAHEIGHNFGSPHDPEQCTPGGEDGNFIMFARATSGDKKNNNKFSPCSLKSIEPVLNAKARSIKGCFTEPQTSICGNGVVEPGEQCDCGWEEDCKDSCCFPMSRHPRIDEKPCTLTPQARCSPSQGPCCTTDCKVKFGDKCRDDNGCRDPSFCDGSMPQCPPSVNKPNKTICNKEFVCYMGDCTGSICLAYGLESCQCIPGPNDDKIKSCELCCKLPGEENPCRSSFEWNESPYDVPDMFAKPGTPCNDYNGYCDVFQKCREVDPSGPLATLRKLLLSEESIASFKKWVQQNWYTVALAVLGVFVLLILSTKLLAKRSNLKLKSVTIIHSATTETVRLPEDNNGVIVHTAVRTKVPFKKKVRGERSGNTKTNGNNTKKLGAAVKMAHKNSSAARGKVVSPTTTTTAAAVNLGDHQYVKKPMRTKKNRVAAPPQPHANSGETPAATKNADSKSNALNHDAKKTKKQKKQNSKEIIDYSTRLTQPVTAATAAAHTNTFGKVQKWLLESPIVAQPLSHIEHSSKVRKVMSKSQSTPERLVQKSPQKTKSMGNLAKDEKVKLQVVYKPPFKFSLRLSKNAKTVKTHVVGPSGGAVGKMKRKSRTGPGNDGKRYSADAEVGNKASGGERTKRSALLLRSSSKNDEDSQVLTLNEPNYETLNPKFSKLENPFYENLQYTQVNEGRTAGSNNETNAKPPSTGGSGSGHISRNSSKTNLENSRPNSYRRSNSLTANNPFSAVGSSRAARKLSDSNSINLNRNFGSTQNLINSSQTNLAKSKKRSSLNLKSSMSKNGKDPPSAAAGKHAKRSNSNLNLHRESNATAQNTNQNGETVAPVVLRRSSSSNAQQQPQSNQSISTTTAATQQQPQLQPQQKLPTYAAQRSTRASFSNIPRASLSLATNVGTAAAATNASTSLSPSATAALNSNHNSAAASCNMPASSSANSHSNNNNNSSFSKFNFSRQSPPATVAAHTATNVHTSASNTPHNHGHSHVEHRRSRSNMTAPTHTQQQRVNSMRQHQHPHFAAPLSGATANTHHHQQQQQQQQQQQEHVNELPSDLEVMVSDVENLVS